MPASETNTPPRPPSRLPDPAAKTGPFRPFSSDPGRDEAWWWLGVPAAVAVLLSATYAFAPEFYAGRIMPEGYGALEISHFFIPFAGMIIALRLLFRPFVRERRLVFAFLCFGALSCFYIAGEEHSWGQHFFYWDTPEYWADLNRQQETNLHNVSHHFDKKPRILLELGILVGGLIVPFAARFRPWIRRNRWSLFLPANALMPTALGAMVFKLADDFLNAFSVQLLVQRPSEAVEFYLYLFLLFYLIVFARRIAELEREAKGQTGNNGG